ncbi:MAG: hypothetical protein ACPGWM_00810, partial [Flavobacteriales bacterium]
MMYFTLCGISVLLILLVAWYSTRLLFGKKIFPDSLEDNKYNFDFESEEGKYAIIGEYGLEVLNVTSFTLETSLQMRSVNLPEVHLFFPHIYVEKMNIVNSFCSSVKGSKKSVPTIITVEVKSIEENGLG